MGRPKSFTRASALDSSLPLFWRQGLGATSVEDVVTTTGINKFGLYAEFGDKRGLFLAALDHYSHSFVSNALTELDVDGAGVREIRSYFTRLIGIAEAQGLPGPGCFMANSLIELAPHDAEVEAIVAAHLDRLTRLFARALPDDFDRLAFAHFLMISAQGLWAYSRLCRTRDALDAYVATLLVPLEGYE